ncbi:MAG: hypothetical protein AAGF23_27485 [Acidobacteriota bacterium]
MATTRAADGAGGGFRKHPLFGLLMIFLAAIGLSAAEGAYRHFKAAAEPGVGARWIWAPGAAERGEPTAFFAVRDLRLEAGSRLWVVIRVDESYSLWVNGRRVGSGTYREGEPAERYDVSDFLKAGWNRFMVEAASSRGAGGVLVSLRLGDPETVLTGSDGDWRLFVRAERSLIAGIRALEPGIGEAPVVWRRPPTGRWRLPQTVSEGQRLAEFDPFFYPRRLRHPAAKSTPEVWRQLEPRERLPHLETQVVLDFGDEVTGHLEMGLDADAGPALLFFDTEDPGPPAGRGADAAMVAVPGQREWHDPQARSFRFVTIVGVAPADWVRVRPAPSAEPSPDHSTGVFGLPTVSPLLRVEEAVWRRLQG